MAMSDDSVAPSAEALGAPELTEDVPARTSEGTADRICASLALTWIAFTVYLQSGIAEGLESRFGAWLKQTSGLSLSFIPTADLTTLGHLLMAVVLATLAFPSTEPSPQASRPVRAWLAVFLAVALAGYLVFFRAGYGAGEGIPQTVHWAAGALAVLVLCLAVRRTVGTALAVVTVTAALIALAGVDLWPRSPTAFDGSSEQHVLHAFWVGTEGVFGAPFDAAITLVIPLVLFGSIWLQAGAGVYISKLAASALGARSGGAGKALVAASAVSACYAPSAKAAQDICITADGDALEGTGFARNKARLIVQACARHAQIAPPIMAIAIVLIAGQTGLSVGRVALHAVLPAAIAYIALYLFVHAEAERGAVPGLPTQPVEPNRIRHMAGLAGWVALTIALVAAAAFAQARITALVPVAAVPLNVAAWFALYLGLLWSASRRPDLKRDAPDAPIAELAPLGAMFAGGLYLLLPLFFLVLQIAGSDRPAGLSVLVCTALAAGIVLTHHPLKAVFRGQFAYLPTAVLRGVQDLSEGLIRAARIMVIVVVAAAAAGLLLASLSSTGLDQTLVTTAQKLTAYHPVLALTLAAACAALLATGMPTAIGYSALAILVVPMLMVPGAQAPAIVVHLSVLYLAVIASAPLPRLAAAPLLLLPFIFFANPELLLVGVPPIRVPVVAATAVLGAVAMGSALHRYLLVPNRLSETLALAVAAVGLLHPGFIVSGSMRDLVYIPALALMGAVWLIQLRRQH